MKELLLYIARNLVDDPEAVSVTEVEGPQELTLELRVAPDDMGKVIGRQGRIAKEIRTVIRSYAQRTGQKVSVDIVPIIRRAASARSERRRPGLLLFRSFRCRCPGCGPAASASPFHCLLVLHRKRQVTLPVGLEAFGVHRKKEKIHH